MPSDSHSKRKSRRDDYDESDEDRRRRKRHDRDDDRRKDRKESKRRDRDGDRYEEEDDRRREKKRDRDSDRKSSRRDHYDSDSPDDRRNRKSSKRRKRSRRDDDSYSDYSSDYDRKRSERKRKKKSKSSSKSSRKHDKKDKKSKPDKSKLFPMGEPIGRSPDTKIDAEQDYFSYHNEFWVYLFREEGICFNDLDTKEARAAFARFAKDYNSGKLEEPYYSRSFPSEVIEESKTTKHSWGFKTTTAERKGLDDLQKGIRRQTEYSQKKETAATLDVRNTASLTSNQVSVTPVESLQRNRFPRTAEERTQQRRDNKKWRDRVKLTHEELAGGPKDFRERRLEKKREQSAKIHGAHKDKESAGVELSDAALYGGAGDSLEATRARLQKSKEKRMAKQNSRIQELQAKEEERKNNMLKMLGLENLQGKKLEIAPRK